MQNIMPNFDQWGPVKVIHVHVPAAGLDGVLVVDNVATGPAIGGGALADYPMGEKLGRDAVVGVECDIWIPAARSDVIRADNVGLLKARLVIEGANIPITQEAERMLHERRVLCVPDVIANAGGVICAAMEYAGASQATVFAVIEDKLRTNTETMLKDARSAGITPREAAERLARRRLEKAMSCRRWGLF